MAGYADTRQMIIDTLMGRMAGTEIQPEDHQRFALQITDYVRSVELVAGNATPIGFADADTVPVQPDNGQAVYLSSVGGAQTVTFSNFIGQNGSPISVTSTANVIKIVTLLWNGQYWSSQITSVNAVRDTTNGYLFMGVASTTTVPGTPDQKVFYLAGAGTYTMFGSNPITIDAGYIGIIRWNGAWSSEPIKISDVVSVAQNNQTRHIDITIGSTTTPVVGAEEIDGLQVGSTTPTNIEYSFLAGKKYLFVNNNTDVHTYVPIYVRETATSSNVLVHNLTAGEKFVYEPAQDYNYLRVVSNVDGTASDYVVYNGIGADVEVLKQETANNETQIEDVKKGKVFDLASSIIEFEQGTILSATGEDSDVPSTFNIRIRTSGYITSKENIVIWIPDTIRLQMIYYYNAETKAFDSVLSMGANGYVTIPYKNNCVIRITMTKADNTQNITPSDVKVFVSKYNDHQQIVVLNDKVAKLENSVAPTQYASNTSTSLPKTVACEFVKDKTYIVRNISKHGEYFALYMRVTEQGTNVETISVVLGAGEEVEFTPTQDGHYIRITAPNGYSGSDVSGDVSVNLKGSISEDIISINKTMEEIQEQVSIQKQITPTVQFDFSHDIIDNDGDADVFGLTPNVYYYPNYLSQLYAKFDALVAAHPNYVSRVDLAEELNIPYPAYASEYKTYMYIFKPTNEAINTTTTKLKKALLVGGEHSGERTSSIALYYIAKGLCECPNDDYFKLRNSFEIHIIPMLEGYGCIHAGQDPLPSGASPNVSRTNYNGVNINRNYPTPNWHVSGTPGDVNYSGASAASEFETQLVLGIVDREHYDMVGDYHSHVETTHVAYSELAATPNTDNESKSRAMYSAGVDISITFKKAYPQYYGVGGDLLPMGPGPNNYANTNGVQYYCMANRGVKLAYLCECPYVIAWTNGQHAGNWEQYFTDIIFNLNEYLFRAQLLRFADWILRH